MARKFIDCVEDFTPWLILLLMHLEVRSGFVLSSLSVFLLFVSFAKLCRETKGIALLLFIAPILVLLFSLFGLTITAYPITVLLGLLLLRHNFRIIISSPYIVLSYLALVVIWILWFIYGPQHTYAQTKLITIISIGTGAMFAWASLIRINSDEARKLARLLVAISLLYMSVALEFFSFPYPSNILDFDLFRNGFYDHIRINKDLPFTYHSMGIPILLAFALLLGSSAPLGKGINLNYVLLLFLCSYLVLLSQARQAILGVFLILLLRSWLSQKLSSTSKIALIILVIGAFTWMLADVETTAFTEAKSGGGLAINRNYSRSFDLIREHPALGVGLGGYSVTGLRDYPHSILWELLSELGFLGTSLVLCCSASQIIASPKKASHYINQYEYIPLLIVVAFGIRALASSDLTESISWIIALLIYGHAIRKNHLSVSK
jgi:membrane protein